MNKATRIIGILSGTSMDGISMGYYEFASNGKPKMLAHKTQKLHADYKDDLLTIIKAGKCTLDKYGQMDRWIGEIFAEAILQFITAYGIDKNTISAIGSHGQTIWHAPQAEWPFTLQIGDPNVIAVRTGITTVADFRRADMAAGGQGAPLAPAFHSAMFSHPNESRCIVNIGGIANFSVLEDNQYRGFDSGPGNCLMDAWVKDHFQLDYDNDGKLAASGTVNETLLNCCLADPYFSRTPPKSSGREYFHNEWLQLKISASGQKISAVDVLATLLQLTAISISTDIKRHASPTTKVYICGGGAHNSALCAEISKNLEQPVRNTAVLGIDPDCVESALFAWLANERITGNAIDMCAITGAEKPVVLGALYSGS